jgi:hypothetical protein
MAPCLQGQHRPSAQVGVTWRLDAPDSTAMLTPRRSSSLAAITQLRCLHDDFDAALAARPWLTVFRLPPYAHELNPVEPVWAHLKRSLANLTKHNLAELTALVKTRLKRMQYRPALLAGFLASTGLEFGPFL